LIIKNAGRFTIVGSIGTIFNFLGKLFITCVTTLAGYAMVTEYAYYADEVSSPIIPTFIYLLISYSISSGFISIFSFCSDTMLQCFLTDEEQSGGKGDHRPASMNKFLDKPDKKSKCLGCCC
jgi:hypothetical protein